MGRKEPTDYTVDLIANMQEFTDDFWDEVKNQSTRRNKASERRMRVLLGKFNDRVMRPYRTSSLYGEASLKEVLGEEAEGLEEQDDTN